MQKNEKNNLKKQSYFHFALQFMISIRFHQQTDTAIENSDVFEGCTSGQVSISSMFYAHIFCTNVILADFSTHM